MRKSREKNFVIFLLKKDQLYEQTLSNKNRLE